MFGDGQTIRLESGDPDSQINLIQDETQGIHNQKNRPNRKMKVDVEFVLQQVSIFPDLFFGDQGNGHH